VLDFSGLSEGGIAAVLANAVRGARFAALAVSLLVAHSVCLAASPPTWIELRSSHFIVVSNASEHEAGRVADQFEMIRSVFLDNSGNVPANDQPVIVVAAKDEETLKPLLPESWTKKGAAHRVGLFLNGSDRSYVGLRLDVSMNQEVYVPYEPIYHEYVHYLTRRLTPHLPVWMVEGLAEFYGNTRIEGNRVLVGTPSTSNLRILHEKTRLPVGMLFEVTASSPYYNEESKVSIFYAESWALTHYLITRDWREKTHRMNDFVALLQQNVPQTDAARRTIGDPGGLDSTLSEYIRNFSFAAVRLDRPKIEQGDLRIRTLSEAESLAVRADFLAHEGQYAKANEMLEQSIKLDPKLAVAYENMGFLCFRRGRTADAEKWSAQALAMNPESDRANYYYAMSLLRRLTRDDEIVGKAEASLRAAIKTSPRFAPAYDALADCLARSGSHQKLNEAYMAALQALDLEPGNISYRVRAVEVLEKQGRAEDAIRVATRAVSLARTPAEESEASASLAGAKQFQISQKKMKDLQEAKASAVPSNGTVSRDPKASDAGSSVSQRSAIEQALRAAAAQNRGGDFGLNQGKPGTPGPIGILSDTKGVDFGPYLNNDVLPVVKQHWYELIPKSDSMKEGKVVLEFAILKDGSVAGLKLVGSTGDVALDRPAYGSITASNPFKPLPREFGGPYLLLRLSYYYNLNLDGSKIDSARSDGSPDGSATFAIAPSGPTKVTAGSTQQFSAKIRNEIMDVTWSLSGPACATSDCGSISSVGRYTAPAKQPDPPDITVTATQTSAPFKSVSVQITIIAANPDKQSSSQ
jgi:tetratricopeptide (TPR) repeat protein